jgi:U3 small nucleolar RNA-associated protein 12
VIHPVADLPLSSRHRVSQITFHPSQPYLAVQSHDRSVEIFRIRSEDEVRKKQARRKKRAKEKSGTGGQVESAMNVEDEMEIKLVDLFTPHIIVRASGKIRSFDFVGSAGGTQVRNRNSFCVNAAG